VQDIDEVVSAASTRNNIPANLIKSVISVESGFNPNAVSRKGAQGLMQLMPETALEMGVKNPFDPSENVEGGARYLHELLGLFHNDVPKALAAYNAGPERVEQYHGVPPYPETTAYVSRVIRNLNQRSNRSQQPFGKQVTDRSVGPSQKGTRSERRKAGALFEASEAHPGRDFERHPLSIN
jgi:soluble lytic murein transglycosylase-like protein